MLNRPQQKEVIMYFVMDLMQLTFLKVCDGRHEEGDLLFIAVNFNVL